MDGVTGLAAVKGAQAMKGKPAATISSTTTEAAVTNVTRRGGAPKATPKPSQTTMARGARNAP